MRRAILTISLCLIAIWLLPFSFSESRYAEVARKIIETGNWITLFYENYQPFWAKPPFSLWLSAIGMRIFGINEFGARILGFLFATLCIGRLKTRDILFSTPAFLVSICAVMTDGCLVGCLTLCFLGASHDASTTEKYLFFIGLGLGLLTKGPFVAVLVFGSLFVFCLLKKSIALKLPWTFGIFITILISLPWYILAEIKTPGFLNYFIIGEHIMRFLQKGWSGDLYGRAHSSYLGIIWVYLAIVFLPWTLFLTKKDITENENKEYLIAWIIFPLLFFSFSKNVVWTYALWMTIPLSFFIKVNETVKNRVMNTVFLSLSFLIILAASPLISWKEKTLTHKYKNKENVIVKAPREHIIDFLTNGTAMYE